MKLSELIATLQKLQVEHGDLPVYFYDPEYGLSDEGATAKYKPALKYPTGQVCLPGRIEISE